jgi:hypothetical protein
MSESNASPSIQPNLFQKHTRVLSVVGLLVIMVVGWNYWLPTAEDYFNLHTKSNLPPNVDFLAYYTAGARFESGANPYYWANTNPEAQDFAEYLYPPTFLPFYLQLARLTYESARLLWVGVYAISYILAFLALLLTMKKEIRITFLFLGLILTIASYPLLLHIRNGQSDVLVISICLLGFVLHSRGYRVVSAVLFAIATLLKVSPVLFLIYFVIFLRDLRFGISYFFATAVLLLFSLMAVPLEFYTDYFVNILPHVSAGTSYWLNQSLLKFFADSETLAKAISGIGFGLFALFTWLLARKIASHERSPRLPLGENGFVVEGVFLMNLLVILIFAGKAWSMTYVWAILPCALLLASLLDARPKEWYLGIVVLAVFLLTSKVYGFPFLDSLNLYGSVILVACLALWLLKRDWLVKKVVDHS